MKQRYGSTGRYLKFHGLMITSLENGKRKIFILRNREIQLGSIMMKAGLENLTLMGHIDGKKDRDI